MKKCIFLSILFVGLAVFQLQAQQEKTTTTDKVEITADQAAAADDAIEKSVCPMSGKVSYYKKSVCPMSGKVSKEAVEWNQAEAKFVSIKGASEGQHSGEKASCGEKKAKSCSKKCSKKCGKSMKSAEASNKLTEEAKEDVKMLKSSSL